MLFAAVLLSVTACKPSQKNRKAATGKKPATVKVAAKPAEETATLLPDEQESRPAPDFDDAALDSVLSFIRSKFPDAESKGEVFKKNRLGKRIEIASISPDQIIQTAESYKGTPHSFGGDSKKGIDCSGLVAVSFRSSGIADFPHGSQEQAYFGKIISGIEKLQRGDLVFFTATYPTPKLLTHVGIYLGNGKFIHSTTSKGVIITDFKTSEYWRMHYAFATRLFITSPPLTRSSK